MPTELPELTARTIIVMGVSGAGKSAVGSALAAHLGRPFIDADDLHPRRMSPRWLRGIRSTTTTAGRGSTPSEPPPSPRPAP